MGFFLDAHPNHISAAFVRMQQEGILVADASRQDTFRPVIPKILGPRLITMNALGLDLHTLGSEAWPGSKLDITEDEDEEGHCRMP
eukprot:1156646-Pelagomonas_calceolata.AAC.1